MSVQFKVRLDWLSVTGKINKLEGDPDENHLLSRVKLAQRMLNELGVKSPVIQTVQPPKYYEVAIVDQSTGIRINFGANLSSQGWQAVLGGHACAGFNAHGVLPHFLETWKARVTRADIAVDLIHSGINILEFADDYRREHGDDGRKTFSYIKGKTGETAYVGSRSSERMVRVYDKGAEQGVPVDWIRVELECKGGHAHAALETYLHNYRSSVAGIRDFIATPDTALNHLLTAIAAGAEAESVITPRAVSDRLKWLNGQVLQSYYKLLEEDYESAGRVWENFHQAYMAYGVWKAFNDARCKVENSLIQSE